MSRWRDEDDVSREAEGAATLFGLGISTNAAASKKERQNWTDEARGVGRASGTVRLWEVDRRHGFPR